MEISAIAELILSKLVFKNGSRFLGIRKYHNNNGEVANHVVVADFGYWKAQDKGIEILNTLTDADFTAIASKYNVTNEAGIVYATNEGARKYLAEGKLPKEGTKARETALDGVKRTKTLSTIRTEIISQMLANRNPETRSAQSQSKLDKFTNVTNCIRIREEDHRVYIYALAHWKKILTEGEYAPTGETKIETAQRVAIERYCKAIGKELPYTKYRNFIVEDDRFESVVVNGEEIYLND